MNFYRRNKPSVPTAERDEPMSSEAVTANASPIGSEQLKKLTQILQKYKAGKAITERRIIASENWWKLRNATEEQMDTDIVNSGFVSKSAWLHGVIVSKHADAIRSFPEPSILPRESGDKAEAKRLSAIVPCVLEQNRFEEVYDDAMWRKMKSGTCAYKVVWDKNKLNGLGDIGVECANILNLYYEPGVTDVQKSRYFFHTELCDKDLLIEKYPEQLRGGLRGDSFVSAKFLYDDHVDTENKVTVIECYYHKRVEGKNTLQYVKYVNDVVLFATENETQPQFDSRGNVKPPMSVTGLYDHGKYPYVFDALYPIEGSPCGYGYVDVCQKAQTEIDILKTSFIRNARVGAIPRFFSRGDGTINEEEFLNLDNPIVHVSGQLDEFSLRPVEHKPIDGSYFNLLQWDVNELKETSGNTDVSVGAAPSGVTSASGIAALQEANGKLSVDSTLSAYRAYSEIVELCIELIRQFYDMPRNFRILGQYGAEEYISYTNQGLLPQHQVSAFGEDMGFRLPVFDIRISAAKKTNYTKVSQNELAIQFFQLGFFNPQLQIRSQALMCLEMMDFDGKDDIMQKVSQNGTLYDKLVQYMQLSLVLAQKAAPQYVEQIAMDLQALGVPAMPQASRVDPNLSQSDNVEGAPRKEHGIVENARERAQNVGQPEGGRVVKEGRE